MLHYLSRQSLRDTKISYPTPPSCALANRVKGREIRCAVFPQITKVLAAVAQEYKFIQFRWPVLYIIISAETIFFFHGLKGDQSRIPFDALDALPTLKSFRIDGAHLTLEASGGDDITPHLQISTIIILNSGVKDVPPGAFIRFPNISMLELSDNEIVNLTEKSFKGDDLLFNTTRLRMLTIRDAGLTFIPKDLLETQKNLKELDLSGNKITVLEKSFFRSVRALQVLNLDRNRIKEIPDYLFTEFTNLKSVSANHNLLKDIGGIITLYDTIEFLSFNDNKLNQFSFSSFNVVLKLNELKEFHLQGNDISIVAPIWKEFNKLKRLDLSRNNFTNLTESDITFQTRNLEIDFKHNHITNINFTTTSQHFNGVPKTHVFLDDNPFKCDCHLYNFIDRLHWSKQYDSPLKLYPENAHCASPPALEGIRIRDLPLSSLTCSLSPEDCPVNCTCNVRPATHSLELDCEAEPPVYPNPEIYQQPTIRLRLKSVQSLNLPSHIVSLNLTGLGLENPPPLETLENIQELDLSRNSLVRAPTELFKANLSLRLAGNPFVCDCSHLDNVYSLLNNVARFDAANVTCSGGKLLINIDPDKLCEVRKAAILGGSLAAVGVLAAIATGLIYKYNLEIKVFLFSRGWCLSWVHEGDIDNAEYDAFVSFSQDDARWVAEQLLPKLEGEPNNYKLCVHYRDWVVGDMIPAQIATSVEQSRRTIVVLTENFLKSTWAPLEFRAANAHAQRERRARVLVVVLGEIPDCEEMDAELRAYLSTNTYLKWGDPWFWEKLKYAMPHGRQNVG
ncbi:hypothetical protein ABMA27_012490 [Loxostege sticticalis]|uniref:TIR domain-containing protein n=1 Tax=Loxostege sticticalis TaxID=481309 RepID=A0ABR3H1I5_LOXSC